MKSAVCQCLTLACAIVVVFAQEDKDIRGKFKTPFSTSTTGAFGPGIDYEESSESPVLYTSYVPLIFKLDRPTWVSMNLNWTEAENCSSSSPLSRKSGYACPIAYHLKQITGNLRETLTLETQVVRGNDSENAIVEDFSCEEIAPHFKSTASGGVTLEDYVTALTDCPWGRGVEVEGISAPAAFDDDGETYKTIMNLVNTSYFHVHTGDQGPRRASLLGMYVALEAIYLARLVSDKERWNSAVTSCSLHNEFPVGLVDKDVVIRALRKIETEVLMEKNYEFSISPANVSKLLSLDLTQCAYTTDEGTMIVRLLAPVRPREFASLEYYQLHTVPAVFPTERGFKLCEMDRVPAEIAYQPDKSLPLRLSCQGKSGSKLCHVSMSHKRDDDDNPTNDRSFECATSMLSNLPDKVVLKHCQPFIRCSQFHLDYAPHIKKISPSTLFYSRVNDGFRLILIRINCDGKERNTFQVSDSSMSEFLLTVPCNCSVWQNGTRIFSSNSCSSKGKNNLTAPITPRPVRRLSLPEEILMPGSLEDAVHMYVMLKQRIGSLEDAVEVGTVGSRRFHALLFLLTITIGLFLSAGAFQLWKWKRQDEKRTSTKDGYAKLSPSRFTDPEDDAAVA